VKMKKTSVILFLGILVPLIFLMLSCATGKKDQGGQEAAVTPESATPAQATPAKPAEETPVSPSQEKAVEVQKPPVAASFLADKHKDAGVNCADCHKETPPSVETPTTTCLTCHEDYKEKAASAIDPHNAHVTFSNCGDCHHAHRVSENQCNSCHGFNLTTP
jgi:hypothetical protein